MLVFRRSMSVPELGASFGTHDAVHEHFRLRVSEMCAVTYDDEVLFPGIPWKEYGDRPKLAVSLQGHIRLRERGAERWLPPGHFAIGHVESLFTRFEPPYVLGLFVEWKRGSIGQDVPIGLPHGKLGPGDLVFLQEAARQLVDGHPGSDATAALVRSVLARLRAVGLPFDRLEAETFVIPVSPTIKNVALSLGHRLSSLEGSPMLVDLERDLNLSRRQVLRAIAEFSERFGYNGTSWRTILDRWRLSAAGIMMTAPDARTEDVARWVGYQGPSALCRAFRQADLPSPANMRGAAKRQL